MEKIDYYKSKSFSKNCLEFFIFIAFLHGFVCRFFILLCRFQYYKYTSY